MRFWLKSVRARLTFWYVVVFGVVLIVYIAGASALLFWQLTSQMYHAEIQDVETAEGLLYFKPDGTLAMHEDYHNHPQSRLLLDRLMEVLGPNGEVLFSNEQLKGRKLGGSPFNGEGRSGYYERSTRLIDGTRVLLISHIHAIDGVPLLIRLAYNTDPLTRRIKEFLALLLGALPIALIVSGFAGYRMAGKVLAPLGQMARQTEQISTSRLHDRIPVENRDDEMGLMATVINGLLARFEQALEQSKRFSSDVSHELRTPLASIRSVGEVGLQQEHSLAGYRDIIGSMLEEVGRLTSMVETLLIMSRAEVGQTVLHKQTLPLYALVNELIMIVEVLAEEKNQKILLTGDSTILVEVDRAILGHAIMNLLDNAVKYGARDTEIRVALKKITPEHRSIPMAQLTVENQGLAIPAALRERVFDRFVRVDEARSREAGGAGLGLSIAKWSVGLHGGEIGILDTVEDRNVFYVRLPLAEIPEAE